MDAASTEHTALAAETDVRAAVNTYTATYSCEDNKLRLYAVSRLDRETYERVKAAGFSWAPKQELFVAPKWTPEREDLLLDLAGEIDDEDTPLAERAAERAERFEHYHDRRGVEAESARKHVAQIAQRFEFGQPILVGHHSERKARKDAERIQTGMSKAVRLWDTARYWESRAERVMRHAAYKSNPRVRANRIRTLEAEKRSHQRDVAKCRARAETWRKVAACEDPEVQLAAAIKLAGESYSYDRRDGLQAGTLSAAQAVEEALASCARGEAYAARWIAHLDNRLAYERVLFGRAPDEETKVDRTRKGAAALPLLNYKVEKIETRNRWREGTESLRQVAMTAAAFKKIHDDYKGTRVSADGTHRVRIAVIPSTNGSGGLEWVSVFIGDSKVHPVPVPKAPPPEPTAEEVEAEIAAEEAERAATAPPEEETTEEPKPPPDPEPAPPNPFEAMRASLKAGVQAVAVPELFVTPPGLAERVVEEAGVEAGDRVLEPEAGLGALALAARNRGAKVQCVEINVAAVQQLGALGFDVVRADFLDLRPGDLGEPFDRVVMNPPFSAEVEHVTHALAFLKPGGRLVAIMSAGVKYRPGGKADAFRKLVKSCGGGIEDLPEDSFLESGTGVRTVLVTMDKETAAA